MPNISIDYSRCDGDGICADTCPMLLYIMHEGRPDLVKGASDRCIACGHCMAVCPKAAISLDGMNPDECVPIEPGLRISSDVAEHFLMRRRSVRVYKDKPVPRHILEEVLDMARWAPSATNRQPVQWIVLEQPGSVRIVANLVAKWMKDMITQNAEAARSYNLPGVVAMFEKGKDLICRGAPHLVLAHAPAEAPFMAQDCTAAITYVELAALARDLGSCWAGFVTWAANSSSELRSHLELPESAQVYGGLMLGYPKYRFRRIPERFEQVVRWR